MKKLIILWILVLFLIAPLTQAALSDDLAICLSMDDTEVSGNISVDLSGGSNFTIDGATTGVSGHLGQAYSFDNGNDQLIARANEITLVGNYTLIAWVNPDSTGDYDTIWSNYDHDGAYHGMIGRLDNANPSKMDAIVFRDAGIVTTTSTSTLPNGGWSQIAMSHNNITGNQSVYINGTFETSGTTQKVIYNNACNTTIGVQPSVSCTSWAQWFGGDIDELMFWNRTLTPTEVTEVFNSGTGKTCNEILNPPVNASEEFEETFLTAQPGTITISGTTFLTVFSASFTSTQDTSYYQDYVIPVISSVNNTVECRILINSTDYDSLTSRTNTLGEPGILNLLTSNVTITDVSYQTELQCRVSSGGGDVNITGSLGAGHILQNAAGGNITHQFNDLNGTVSGSALQEINTTTFTTSNNGNLTQQMFIDWRAEYINSGESLVTQLEVNGTTCASYPRFTASGATGVAGGLCVINTTPSTTYTINLTGNGTAATYNFKLHTKEFIINSTTFNTTTLTGTSISSATLTKLTSINLTDISTSDANIFVKAGIPAQALGTDGQATFQIRISGTASSTSSNVTRQITDAKDGITIIEHVFNTGIGTYEVELWGACSNPNCNITGGELTAYLSDAKSITANSFNLTVNDADLTALTNFTVFIDGGGTFPVTNGNIEIFTTQDLINFTVTSPTYFNRTIENHNTTNDLTTVLHQSEIKVRSFEKISNATINIFNMTLNSAPTAEDTSGSIQDDAGVIFANPTLNSGNSGLYSVSSFAPNGDARIYLEVKITNPNATRYSYFLDLYSDSIFSAISSVNINFTACNSVFNETNITWSNQATEVTGCNSTSFQSIAMTDFTENAYNTINITDAVANDADGIFTILIIASPEQESIFRRIRFLSTETAINKPVISASDNEQTVFNLFFTDDGVLEINSTLKNQFADWFNPNGTYFNITNFIFQINNATEEFNLTGFYTSQLTVFANHTNSTNLTDFFVNITSLNFTSWPGEQINVTTGNITFNLIDGTYRVDVTAGNFFGSQDVVVSSTLQNVTITVSEFDLDNCTSYSTVALNFTIFNESDNSTVVSDLDLFIDVFFGGNTIIRNRSFDFRNNFTYQVCMTPANANASVNAQMEYVATGFSKKTYYLKNSTITNTTTDISLFLTENTSQVTFTVTDFDDDPIPNAIIKVLSYDLGSNTFQTTEILSTDTDGEALGQLVLNTEWYAFIIEIDGVVKFQSLPAKVVSTSLTFRIDVDTDYYNIFQVSRGISSSLTFTDATQTFNFLFTDPTGKMQQGCLKVEQQGPLGTTLLEKSCLTTTAGTILIAIPGNTSNNIYLATGYVIIEGSEFVLQKLSQEFKTGFERFGLDGIMMVMLLVLTLIMSQLWSPEVAVVFGMIGVVISVIMGVFSLSYFAIGTFVIISMLVVYRIARKT